MTATVSLSPARRRRAARALTLRIVSRAERDARHDDGAGPAPLPALEGAFLHHSVTAYRNGADAMRQLDDIGEARFGKGCSYTFGVTPDGTIYEGHSVGRLGSHTKGYNTTGRGIVLIGNYADPDHDGQVDTGEHAPTAAQREAVAQLLAHGVRAGWWPTTRLRPHRAVRQTECPGDHAAAAIPAIVRRADELLAGAVTKEPFTVDQYDQIMQTLDRIEDTAQATREAGLITLDLLRKVNTAVYEDYRAQLITLAEQRDATPRAAAAPIAGEV